MISISSIWFLFHHSFLHFCFHPFPFHTTSNGIFFGRRTCTRPQKHSGRTSIVANVIKEKLFWSDSDPRIVFWFCPLTIHTKCSFNRIHIQMLTPHCGVHGVPAASLPSLLVVLYTISKFCWESNEAPAVI